MLLALTVQETWTCDACERRGRLRLLIADLKLKVCSYDCPSPVYALFTIAIAASGLTHYGLCDTVVARE